MLVVLGRSGRLGNRLQLAAYAAALAIECDMPAALLCLAQYRGLFRGSHRDPLCRLPSRVGSHWDHVAQHFVGLAARMTGTRLAAHRAPGMILDEPRRLAELRRAETIVLHGYYFYAAKLLRKHAPAIRDYFQLAQPAPVLRFLDAARRKRDRLVGVHIRHGDYAKYRGGEHYFTLEQYAHVMRQVRDLIAPWSVHFVVCSDARQVETAFADLSWERGPGEAVTDLYALAGCDFVLGPCSTFNRWSAFVGDVPRYELRDPTRILSLSDFAPPADLTLPDVSDSTPHPADPDSSECQSDSRRRRV